MTVDKINMTVDKINLKHFGLATTVPVVCGQVFAPDAAARGSKVN